MKLNEVFKVDEAGEGMYGYGSEYTIKFTQEELTSLETILDYAIAMQPWKNDYDPDENVDILEKIKSAYKKIKYEIRHLG